METKLVQYIFRAVTPYAIYLALAGLALAWTLVDGSTGYADVAWTSMRWLVRIGVIAYAANALNQSREDPRPLWVYGWLGFATYEAVAAVLALAMALLTRPNALGLIGIPLLMLAFLPFVLTALWVGLRSVRLAAYTIFPHAALTLPLFLLGDIVQGIAPGTFLAASLAPIVIAGLTAVVWKNVPRDKQWATLYGSVIICQALFGIGMTFEDVPISFVFFLVLLGVFILSTPAILLATYQALLGLAIQLGWDRYLPYPFLPKPHTVYQSDHTTGNATSFSKSTHGGEFVSNPAPEEQSEPVAPERPASAPQSPPPRPPARTGPSTLDRLYKGAVVTLTALIILAVGVVIARAAVYKVHEYERGLHLRGGRFVGVQLPGWHMQIPLVDTVIIVKTSERLGYVEQIPAMTSDNVTMLVSLQYTYKVDDPEQYALQVDDPERIVFEFVQGKLRDVVNTKDMSDVMENRSIMNQEVMEALKEKEEQYGVRFVTVQMQNASPPEEVLTAIKDRMVASQRQEQAQAEAIQRQTQADAELYAAEKQADAEAYQITTTAKANAERIRLTTEAEKEATRALLAELDGKGTLGEAFIEYLIAQELKENSKWVIGGEGTPILDMR